MSGEIIDMLGESCGFLTVVARAKRKVHRSIVWPKAKIRKTNLMANDISYPVPNRTPLRNLRIAGHEIGHAFVSRALGDTVHAVTIIPDRGPNGFEGRCIRSGPISELTLTDCHQSQTEEILSICERLEKLTPELGCARVESSEYYIRAQNNITELVAAECAELILHPDLPALGAVHDFVEADAFARVAVAAQPAVTSLVEYCRAEATALLTANIDIVNALVEALIESGTLSGAQIDEIISREMAMRSIRLERQRRDDWQRREQSAARFSAACEANGELCHE